ncbi:MAG: hypothetical protein AB1746_02905 [Candidatus Zixiibacteriota bacterium]
MSSLHADDVKVEMNGGICINCVGVDTCAYKKGGNTPVMYCEEFRYPAGAGSVSHQPISDYSKYVVETMDTSLGLCCNCDSREACVSTRNPKNVLYCEEYN